LKAFSSPLLLLYSHYVVIPREGVERDVLPVDGDLAPLEVIPREGVESHVILQTI